MSGLREFDLRERRATRLGEELGRAYPEVGQEARDARALRRMRACHRAGVPLEYLVATWDDFQGDRERLARVRAFADALPFHARSGGGLVIIGANGTGKSLLSYMVAVEAVVRHRLPTLCVSVREWVDRKVYQRHNPALFAELLGLLDEARVVVVDNLSREGEKLYWGPEDVFEIVDRATGGGRAMVLNTNMTRRDYEQATGSSALSRTAGFERVTLERADDFRGRRTDAARLLARRAAPEASPACYRPLPFLADQATRRDKPAACGACAYSARPRLCEIRMEGTWTGA